MSMLNIAGDAATTAKQVGSLWTCFVCLVLCFA